MAPVERIKILFQVQGLSAQGRPMRHTSVVSSLRSIYASEGMSGLFKGNGANVARIIPMSGLQFLAFDLWCDFLFPGISSADLSPTDRLAAGALAGATAQVRLLWSCWQKIVRPNYNLSSLSSCPPLRPRAIPWTSCGRD